MPAPSSFQRACLLLGGFMAVGCAGVLPAGTAPPSAPQVSASATPAGPTLAGPSRAPGAGLVDGRPAPVATPTPRVSPSPVATPTPAWTTVETETWLVRHPASWARDPDFKAPGDALGLRQATTGATITLEGMPTAEELPAHQERARLAAGPGLVRVESIGLDGLRGYLVLANVDTADGGKRRVATRGFIYRGKHWKLIVGWDPRSDTTNKLTPEVDAILATFRWL